MNSKFDDSGFDNNDQIEIGLIVAKQIIHKFGGKFDFFSEPNKGSTFVFSFDLEIYQDPESERSE